MKVLNKIVMGCAALVLLTGCATKCTFEKFKEKATEAAQKDSGYKKCVVKGSATAGGQGMSLSFTLNHEFIKTENGWVLNKGETGMSEAAAAVLMSYRAIDWTYKENANCTYYAGNGFKVVEKTDDGEGTMKFDKFGYVTSDKGKTENYNADVTVRWSK